MTEPQIDVVVLDGGRRVAIHRLITGDTDRTLVLCHPAPGAGTFDPNPEQTVARGVTLLALDRPGYGQSDPLPAGEWSTVGSAADDVAAVLARSESKPVGVVGWSAGGRVALALAARHPALVDRVVVLGTPAPHEAVPWMPRDQQEALAALRDLPADVATAVLQKHLTPFIPSNTSAAGALSSLMTSSADGTALAQPGARDRLVQMLEVAFTQGAAGLASDIAGYGLQPWGFEPEAVQAKTLLLYGSQDPIAGPRHGTWWQKHLSNARLEVVPGAGHLLILVMWHRALSHLAPGVKRQR